MNHIAHMFTFETPDEITRSHLSNYAFELLKDLQSKRALNNFSVICDDTNNPPLSAQSNDLHVTINLQPTHAANFVTMNMDLFGGNILARLVNLEVAKHGFMPGSKIASRKFVAWGIVGIDSGFVCDPSKPDCDAFFVLSHPESTHYLLCDSSYRYFTVSSDYSELRDYTTGDMVIIDCAIEKYMSQN